ncbi:hypothetical protein LINPERHAP2_LOCUS34052 [Linum perenne]
MVIVIDCSYDQDVECGNRSYDEDHGGHAGEPIVVDKDNDNEREPMVLDEENEKEPIVLDDENEVHNANGGEVDRGLVGPENEDVWRELRFDNLDDCQRFYTDYGRRMLFDTRISYRSTSGRKGDDSGKLWYIGYACNKSKWKKDSKLKPKAQIGPAIMDPDPVPEPERLRPETQIGCPAEIRMKYDEYEDKYKIYKW